VRRGGTKTPADCFGVVKICVRWEAWDFAVLSDIINIEIYLANLSIICRGRDKVMQRRFKVILEWDSDDKVYVATVPAIPGCSTYGNTKEEALAMVEDAIKVTLEGLEATGQLIPLGDVDISIAEVVVSA